jgi:hypothetical protein
MHGGVRGRGSNPPIYSIFQKTYVLKGTQFLIKSCLIRICERSFPTYFYAVTNFFLVQQKSLIMKTLMTILRGLILLIFLPPQGHFPMPQCLLNPFSREMGHHCEKLVLDNESPEDIPVWSFSTRSENASISQLPYTENLIISRLLKCLSDGQLLLAPHVLLLK